MPAWRRPEFYIENEFIAIGRFRNFNTNTRVLHETEGTAVENLSTGRFNADPIAAWRLCYVKTDIFTVYYQLDIQMLQITAC